jgi:voltage-gated potassium channel
LIRLVWVAGRADKFRLGVPGSKVRQVVRQTIRQQGSPFGLRQQHRDVFSLALMAFAVIMVGTVGYSSGPRYGWLDAFYMTFLMVATIGYGAGVEIWRRPETEIFTMAIAFSGIAVMTYFFSSVTALVLASDFDKSLRRRRMDKVMKKLHEHYILCGFGRVGRNVAQELEATNRHYIAIDENIELLEGHAEKRPGTLYIHGDAVDDDILIEANVHSAKGVFAITGDDSRNLMIALTARQLAPQVRIVARCNEMRNVEKLRKAGADAIVSPNFTGGMRIASAMIRPHVVSFLDEMLRTEHKLRVEEVVPGDFVAKTFGEMNLKGGDYVMLAVRTRGDWVFNPPADLVVHQLHLIAMASRMAAGDRNSLLEFGDDLTGAGAWLGAGEPPPTLLEYFPACRVLRRLFQFLRGRPGALHLFAVVVGRRHLAQLGDHVVDRIGLTHRARQFAHPRPWWRRCRQAVVAGQLSTRAARAPGPDRHPPSRV